MRKKKKEKEAKEEEEEALLHQVHTTLASLYLFIPLLPFWYNWVNLKAMPLLRYTLRRKEREKMRNI